MSRAKHRKPPVPDATVVIDYNGFGVWNAESIQSRYLKYAVDLKCPPRDLSPVVIEEKGCRWIYPVMDKVIEGIEAGDPACIRIGVELIEENDKFPFGKILKSKTARVLRRAPLTDDQTQRIRRRVFGLLRDGHIPHEYRDYAKLVRWIGFTEDDMPRVISRDYYVQKFVAYFQSLLPKCPKK